MLDQAYRFNLFYWLIVFALWAFVILNKEDWKKLFELMTENDYFFMLKNLNFTESNNHRIAFCIMLTFLYLVSVINSFKTLHALVSVLVFWVAWKCYYFGIKIKFNTHLKQAKDLFPNYLNNLAMLIQDDPVPIAIAKSIDSAPLIFINEIKTLVKDIHEGYKEGIIPFLEFASKYTQIDDITHIMKTLYNLSITTIDKEKIITSITKMANEKISVARKIRLDGQLDKQTLFAWLGFLWIGIVIIALFFALNLESIGI